MSQTAFEASHGTLKEIAQGLMAMKAQATSLENSVLAFLPLAGDKDTEQQLADAGNHAHSIGAIVSDLYRKIAKEAARDA